MVDLGQTPAARPSRSAGWPWKPIILIGLGGIVPHHIPGYSAGAKIIQPGISGAGDDRRDPFPEHPHRAARTWAWSKTRCGPRWSHRGAGRAALHPQHGARFAGRLVGAFAGHPVQAHRAGAALAPSGLRRVLPAPGRDRGRRVAPLRHRVLAGPQIALPGRPGGQGRRRDHRGHALPRRRFGHAPGNPGVSPPCRPRRSSAHPQRRHRATWSPARWRWPGPKCASAPASSWSAPASRPKTPARWAFAPFATVDAALQAALADQGAAARVAVLTHAPDMLPLP